MQSAKRLAAVAALVALLMASAVAAAHQGWSMKQWQELADWCSAHPVTLDVPDCSHGLGHSAWDSTLDRTKAASICKLLSVQDWRVNCGDGVAMQEFQPVTGPVTKLIDESGDVTSVCAHIPVGDTTGVRQGCIRGVGLILFDQAAARVEADSGGPVGLALQSKIDSVIAPCRQFGDEAVHCAARIYFLLRAALGSSMEDPIGKICPRAGEFEEECRKEMSDIENLKAIARDKSADG